MPYSKEQTALHQGWFFWPAFSGSDGLALFGWRGAVVPTFQGVLGGEPVSVFVVVRIVTVEPKVTSWRAVH
ncbi:hypothetical protein [Azospirillum endophyticum]